MLPAPLKNLIQHPEPFLQSIDDSPNQLRRRDHLSLKFDNVRRCLLGAGAVDALSVASLWQHMNDDILRRLANGGITDAEKQYVQVQESKRFNQKKKKSEKMQFVIPEKQVQRFRDAGYASKLKDIAVLLIYLEVPFAEWENYYQERSDVLASIYDVLAPDIPLTAKQATLAGSWDAYMYDPLSKQVFSHPMVISPANHSAFHITCRGLNDRIYSGIAVFYGNYLVGTLLNEKKSSAITIQTYIDEHVLNNDPVLNAACTWVQTTGKPMQSVVIIYRAYRTYVSHQLPATQEKMIRNTDEPHELKVNHFIEYVSRKGEPELSPRWFKPNRHQEVEGRNKMEASRPRSFHLREDYAELARFFTVPEKAGEWISFSKPYGPHALEGDSVSISRWTFTSHINRHIIEAECAGYKTGRKFEGALQYKQGHISVYGNSQDGFRHFMAPLDLVVVDHGQQAQQALRGYTSIIENNYSFQLRELLVYTDRWSAIAARTRNGKLLVEDFMVLDVVGEGDKEFVVGMGE